MIKRVYIDNYRCFVNFELPLKELTLLVGPNGVGKSSVLDVLSALQRLLSGAAKVLDPGVFPRSSLTRWQERAIQVFELDVCVGEDCFNYRLEVEHESETRKARVRYEGLTVEGKPLFSFTLGEVQLYRDNHSTGPTFASDWSESALARVVPRPDNRRVSAFLEYVRALLVCGLYPRSFLSESTAEEPSLRRDGANFVSWYRHMAQEHQDMVSAYFEAIRDVIGGFRSIRLERVGTDARSLMAMFGERTSKYELRLDELSDGERALLVLYALVNLTGRTGNALFLDEPDNYVSLPEIQPWLIALADACGGAVPQAVVCSHHPEVLDYLGGDHGLMLEREVSGMVKVRQVADIGIPDGMRLSEAIARGWER